MEERDTFEAVRTRLDEIVEAVAAEDVTLDEALALYEEAVKLGLSACDLSEKDVEAAFPEDLADAGDEPAAAPADAEAAAGEDADAADAEAPAPDDAEPAEPVAPDGAETPAED